MESTIQSTVILGAGCFWCVEAVFLEVEGVSEVISGYTGGEIENPSYKAICTGTTGHAEVAKITYDSRIVSYQDLLSVFWTCHDPTTLNRQGNDVGTQYRSSIFYQSEEELAIALKSKEIVEQSGLYSDSIVTTFEKLGIFYPAENYHQNYYATHQGESYCAFVVRPKLEKFREMHKALLKKK